MCFNDPIGTLEPAVLGANLKQRFPKADKAKDMKPDRDVPFLRAAEEMLNGAASVVVTTLRWAVKAGYRNGRTVQRALNTGLADRLKARGIVVEAVPGVGLRLSRHP